MTASAHTTSKNKKDKDAKSPPIYVLDSTVFLNNLSYLFNSLLCVTTPLVEEEMKSPHARIEFYRSQSLGMEIIIPQKKYIEMVEDLTKKTQHKISNADVSVIALALQLQEKGKKAIVVSDDYSVQDITLRLGINILSLLRPPTKKHYTWKRICIGCRKEINEEKCEVCGRKGIYISYREDNRE